MGGNAFYDGYGFRYYRGGLMLDNIGAYLKGWWQTITTIPKLEAEQLDGLLEAEKQNFKNNMIPYFKQGLIFILIFAGFICLWVFVAPLIVDLFF